MSLSDPISQVIALSVQLARVKRRCGYWPRPAENDAEHSYQLALTAWTANHAYDLHLDDTAILKLALVHDLVEIYAGDVDAHSNKKRQMLKKMKEMEALKQLQQAFPDLSEITDVIKEYEKKESLESKLVNIIDKIIPIQHVYNRNDTYYKRRKVTKEDYRDWLLKKTDYVNLPRSLQNIVTDILQDVTTKYARVFFIEKSL